MDVAATGAAAGTTRPKSTVTEATSGGLSGDFETFLKLLTAQMQNQDPLQPTDNTEFVSQLASFSAVEQQVQSNRTLEAINNALAASGSAGSLASWLGREVLSEGSAQYAGNPVAMEFTPASGANRATLEVRNMADQVVAQVPVAPANPELTWDGRDAASQEVPFGSYTFKVTSYSDETMLSEQSGLIFSEVTEVRMGSTGPELVLAGGTRVAADDVKAVK
jgi:flagellar basal-body rod modification protein FlgD